MDKKRTDNNGYNLLLHLVKMKNCKFITPDFYNGKS
jgi:hypothetical protein